MIGPGLVATNWQEQNRQILNALKLERIVTVVTIGLIQVVAALNILIALVMMVMEKHRDIAILMSMGARAQQIRRIFVWEGAMIGAVGTVIGMTVGYKGGKLDEIVMRFMDGLMAFPAILLAIALMAARGPGVWNVIIALSLVYMPRTALLTRSTVLSLRELD